MSRLAQEEARSISENVTWGRRKRFADGKVTIPYGRFLGYDKGPDGNLVINQAQAVTVRYIYSLYLHGQSLASIARTLQKEGYQTATGNKHWSASQVRNILTNEKYKGDALLQKSYITDFLTKKQIKNEGEVPQYYVTGNYEPIITPAVWDFVQAELAAPPPADTPPPGNAPSLAKSGAPSAGPGTGRKPGMPIPNTKNASGGATTNTQVEPRVRPRTSVTNKSPPRSSTPSTTSSPAGTRSTSWSTRPYEPNWTPPTFISKPTNSSPASVRPPRRSTR